MDAVVSHSKRILKPQGSALFILQPNSEHVGTMRLWLWEFLIRTAKDWNLIQDLYWWNFTMFPTVHCHRDVGLMKPCVKYLLWFGHPHCYRCQDEILWMASDTERATRLQDKALRYLPSGMSMRDGRALTTSKERGGSSPCNLLPLSASNSATSSGAYGHGAGTPEKLCDWLIRYLCPPGGTILDPFSGAGTMGLAAVKNNREYIGIEQNADYCEMARQRLKSSQIHTTCADGNTRVSTSSSSCSPT